MYDHNGREVVEIEEILLFNVVGLVLRTGVTADFGPPTPPPPSKSVSEYGPPVQICQRIWTPHPPPSINFPFEQRLYYIW